MNMLKFKCSKNKIRKKMLWHRVLQIVSGSWENTEGMSGLYWSLKHILSYHVATFFFFFSVRFYAFSWFFFFFSWILEVLSISVSATFCVHFCPNLAWLCSVNFLNTFKNVFQSESHSCPVVLCHWQLSWGMGRWQGTRKYMDQMMQRMQETGNVITT